MSIFPLPVFEADADPHHRQPAPDGAAGSPTDADIYERLEPPKTMVVRFGKMKLVGEYPYGGDAKPGCGSKVVVRTHRGTEMAEMLTTTCENAGCAKSVTRQEMLNYIDQSGGRDYPFFTRGRALRVATVEDMNKQSALESERMEQIRSCRRHIEIHGLNMKLVEAEPILGGELLTFYYMAEERIDFRDLVKDLAAEFRTRIEMRQVGARDEARLVADYERCGQHCCCKSFLKVLKPVSMKSAKMQKATLDPLKISGRCGRLMCCLRYEDKTYKELKAALPRRKTLVGTSEGPGIVLDTKTLVQLVLVKLEHDGREIAVPVEELMDPETCPRPGTEPELPSEADPLTGMPPSRSVEKTKAGEAPTERKKRRRRRKRKGEAGGEGAPAGRTGDGGRARDGQKRTGRPAGGGQAGAGPAGPAGSGAPRPQGAKGPEAADGQAKPKRRRRRRRRRGGSGGDKPGGNESG